MAWWLRQLSNERVPGSHRYSRKVGWMSAPIINKKTLVIFHGPNDDTLADAFKYAFDLESKY